MTKELLNEIENDYWNEKADPIDMAEVFDLANKALEQTSFKGKTNGEVIKAMFPDVDVKEKNNGYEVYFGVGTAIQFFNHQWWNAPYKVESEEEK